MKKYIKASSNSVSELAKFIKDSVNTLLTTDYTNSRYVLDEDWAVYVGWSNAGYDENDDSIIHAEDDPKWVICVKIATAHEYAWYDFDWCDMPYDKETGEVWDTEIAISPNENYRFIAEWLLEEYAGIIEEYGNEADDYDGYDDEDYEYI